jgi:hypothetical protein
MSKKHIHISNVISMMRPPLSSTTIMTTRNEWNDGVFLTNNTTLNGATATELNKKLIIEKSMEQCDIFSGEFLLPVCAADGRVAAQ